MIKKIYVASSWRNDKQPMVVDILRKEKFEVYDFKDSEGFNWSEIDPDWKNWSTSEFVIASHHELANKGFTRDMEALNWCDAGVLVLPCGRSAHLEAGYLIGKSKPVFIWQDRTERLEPELMYNMATVCMYLDEVVSNLQSFRYEPEDNKVT